MQPCLSIRDIFQKHLKILRPQTYSIKNNGLQPHLHNPCQSYIMYGWTVIVNAGIGALLIFNGGEERKSSETSQSFLNANVSRKFLQVKANVYAFAQREFLV